MADDGYLIGYEDSNNNFVEVGRFNNAAEDTSQPILIEHTASGERMELDGGGFDYQNADVSNVGAFSSDSVNTEDLDIGSSDFVEQSNFYPVGLSQSISDGSTTSSSYTSVTDFEIQLNSPLLSAGDANIAFAITGFADPGGDQIDIRLTDQFSGDTLVEGVAVDAGFVAGPSVASFDTGRLKVQIRNSDGATEVSAQRLGIFSGIQL